MISKPEKKSTLHGPFIRAWRCSEVSVDNYDSWQNVSQISTIYINDNSVFIGLDDDRHFVVARCVDHLAAETELHGVINILSGGTAS